MVKNSSFLHILCILYVGSYVLQRSKGVEVNGSSYSSCFMGLHHLTYKDEFVPVCQLATFSCLVQLSQEVTFSLTRYHFDKVLIPTKSLVKSR